jgi:hypothetical protein
MGVLCRLEELSDSQAITATANSTNVIDTTNSSTFRDLASDPVWLVVQVDVVGTGGGTVTISLVSSDAAALTTPVVHWVSPAFTDSQLTAGMEPVKTPLPNCGVTSGSAPVVGPPYRRYVGLIYTVAATVTALKLSAFLTQRPPTNVIYPTSANIG